MQNQEELRNQEQRQGVQAYDWKKQDMGRVCKNYMHRYVLAQMHDGRAYDGIIEHVDPENVYLAVPHSGYTPEYAGNYWAEGYMQTWPPHWSTGQMYRGESIDSHNEDFNPREEGEQEERSAESINENAPDLHTSESRQWFGPGFGYPGYGPWYGYGFGYPYGFGFPGRFSRLILPLAALSAISLLPYF